MPGGSAIHKDLAGLEAGDMVRVDHPRFRGFGQLRYFRRGADQALRLEDLPSKIYAAVKLENGNTWFYEIETIRPVLPDEEELAGMYRAKIEREVTRP